MNNRSRIPRTIMTFNDYINVIVTYLLLGDPVTNWSRLGLLDEEMKWLQTLLQDWNKLYTLYADKKGGRTAEVIESMNSLITKMLDYNQKQHLLDRIASSLNATTVDWSKFNINGGDRSFSKGMRSAIQDVVEPTLEPIKGGVVAMKCYGSESSRPAIHGDANCVQFAYCVGTEPPAMPDDPGMIHDISSRASFSINLGPASSGKKLYIFFRWYNTIHPDTAGPWTGLITIWLS